MIVLPTFGIGGVEVRTARLVNALGDEFGFRIVSLDGRTAAASLITGSVRVEGKPPRFAAKNTAIQIIRSGWRLCSMRPDLLQTYNWGTFEWWPGARRTGVCPHILGEDGFADAERLNPQTRRQILRRLFLQHCKNVVLPSKGLMQSALRDWRLSPRIAAYIPNGVDTQRFNRPKPKGRREITLVSIASLTPVKNHLRLLRAFLEVRRAHRVKLLLAGVGPEEARIRRFIGENALSERVELLGYREDVPALLQTADCFCLSSDSEQMPVSVLEAMAAGCPVLGTDVGDVAAMVSDVNRPFVVDRDDPSLYQSRMEELVASADLRARIGKQNRDKCRRCYSEERMIDSYRKLYRNALAPRWRSP